MFLANKRKVFAAFAFLFIIPCTAGAVDALFVAKINSGDEVVLQDGRVVHLQGIKAPSAGSGTLSMQAIALIQKLTNHIPVALDNAFPDRYGRVDAQIYLKPEGGRKTWLQKEILHQGMAFVYPPVGNEARIADMLDAENDAYRAHCGIWGDSSYADIPARQAQDYYGHFAIVTGKIVKASRAKNVVYLNFGPDWRTSFMVSIAAHDLKAFRKADIEPLAYEGNTVRVRGWVKRDYGPMIAITSPYQIQVLN